jgi:hypothetical protein
VITDDQVVALLGRANPVPSLDLLDPIEPIDLDRLEDQSERSSAMTKVQTTTTIDERDQHRRRLTPVLVALGAVMVAVPLIWRGVASVQSSPMGVADSYMAALADHDRQAAESLLASDVEGSDADYPFWDHDRATGWEWVTQDCEKQSTGPGGTLVHCPYLVENAWTQALRLPPDEGFYIFLIDQGQISAVTDNPVTLETINAAADAFFAWLEESHPDDMQRMVNEFNGQPLLDTEATALFERYTDEFVAEMEAGG